MENTSVVLRNIPASYTQYQVRKMVAEQATYTALTLTDNKFSDDQIAYTLQTTNCLDL
jgi:hypothetical protein